MRQDKETDKRELWSLQCWIRIYVFTPNFRQLFSLTEANGTWMNKLIDLCGSDMCQGNLESSVHGQILSFGEDEEGLYKISCSKHFVKGTDSFCILQKSCLYQWSLKCKAVKSAVIEARALDNVDILRDNNWKGFLILKFVLTLWTSVI